MKQKDEKDLLREMNLLKAELSKPTMSGFVVVNLRTGKTRKLKVGEFKPMVIDHSDPSYADGDIVEPEKR